MPRRPRKEQIEKNIAYHVYNRGNGKLDVFHNDSDFSYFLGIVERYKKRHNLSIFHWVLMNNHFHLALTIGNPAMLSKCIGGILQVYAQHHHKKHNGAGRLWQGRFVSQPVQKDDYLLECGRYIERNPVKAGITTYPWDYRWSSCKAYVNDIKDEITTFDPEFSAFKEASKEGIERYKNWLMERELPQFNNMGHPVGNGTFLRHLQLKEGRLVGRSQGRPHTSDVLS